MSTLAFVSSKTEAPRLSEFACDVHSGLTRPGQKELHSKYLYDDLGTALFQAITVLPEYGLTRADGRILRGHASEIVEGAGVPTLILELGSGTGQKTRHLLEAIETRPRLVRYCPIDVSQAALDQCERELGSVAEVLPMHASYLAGVRRAALRREAGEPLLVLFLGSTIGNFEAHCALEFLSELHDLLQPGDALLLGADLVKPVEQLLAAYDDPTGVTAAFNLNLLARVNRELGADFDLRKFEHQARYAVSKQRIEMYLRSRVAQRVSIPGAGFCVKFLEGETIWTESSHKYQLPQLKAMARQSGFRVEAEWIDREWPFVESLWIAN